jgi:two-component system, response regulator
MNTPVESIEIVLVEDNPDDVALIRAALEESNIVNKIVHLKDGAEATDYLFHEGSYASQPEDNNPKIIMLDLNMPKISGIELLQKIKSSELQDIPIVVFTSSKEDPNLRECYRLGVKNYIVKPLDFEQFKKAINQSIKGLLMYVSQIRWYK